MCTVSMFVYVMYKCLSICPHDVLVGDFFGVGVHYSMFCITLSIDYTKLQNGRVFSNDQTVVHSDGGYHNCCFKIFRLGLFNYAMVKRALCDH